MGKKDDFDVFLENFPAFKTKKAILIFVYHFIIFLVIMFAFWHIRQNYWILTIPAQFLITLGANVPLIYIIKNFDKIREKYLKKYKEYPWQRILFHYSYTSPCGAAALYSPLLLINYDFLPTSIQLPSHFMTNNLFPFYISIPLGIFVIIFALLVDKPAGDHDRDRDLYIYLIYPQQSRTVKEGIYQYVRHPRLIIRYSLSLGIALIVNNLLAISVSVVHFIPYAIYIYTSDKELLRRFGEEYKSYREKVPILIPKYGNWKKFLKMVFLRKKD